MKKILLVFCVTLTNLCAAQNRAIDSVQSKKHIEDTLAKRVEYFFNVQAGSLVGCNDCSQGKDVTFSMETVHGITVGKKFRAGLGVGFDSYVNWNTIPFFLTASWDLIGNKNKNALFVQMSYGWAHPWFIKDGYYADYAYDPFTNVSGKRLIKPSIGYRIKYHDLKLSVLASYQWQRIHYSEGQYVCAWCENYPAPFVTNEITQDMNRVHVMMSVGWK